MKCHYCGTETDQIFCHHCGTRQNTARERTIPEVQAQVTEDQEFAWQPFQSGEQAHQLPTIPNYYEKDAPEMGGISPAAVSEPDIAPAPRIQLPTCRSLWKMILLGILTLGIYPVVIWSRIVTELNLAASRYDGKRTMPYFGMILLAPLTLTVYVFVWFHGFSRRVGMELKRRKLGYRFGAKDFWLWNVLGSLILVGPFVYLHKLMKSMNLINGDYNVKG